MAPFLLPIGISALFLEWKGRKGKERKGIVSGEINKQMPCFGMQDLHCGIYHYK